MPREAGPSGGTNLKFKTSVTLLICLALVAGTAGCGGNQLQSITVTPNNISLVGIGATGNFTVTANYSNGSKVDLTTASTYTIASPNPVPVGSATFVAPANAVTINPSGIVQEIAGVCTWTAGPIVPPATTPGPSGTNPYIVTVTVSGQVGTAFVSAASTVGCPHP